MTDPMPGLTVYHMGCREALDAFPGPHREIEAHRRALWANVELFRAARAHPGLFGAVVRLRRIQRGWSQRHLAERTGYHQAQIWAVEAGKVAVTDAFGPQMIHVLGITLDDLTPEVVTDEAA